MTSRAFDRLKGGFQRSSFTSSRFTFPACPPIIAHQRGDPHPMSTHPSPATVGQLKQTPYRPRSVKDELRSNLIRKLKAGEELFPGIIGYRDTVIPQIIN